ncbi:NAD+ synthase [Candidatus Omnitrophota bacterium]
MESLNINPKNSIKKLTAFISNTVKSKGFEKVILGLSGGLDSSVVAYLSQKALGRENVIGVFMPYGKLSNECLRQGKKVAASLKIRSERIDISGMIEAYRLKAKDMDRVRLGNKMARERMSILYDLSKKYNALVIGTSNKTEILLGYGTMHGDVACALNPLGNLYKSQVRILARSLGVPSGIICRPPTAGLWHGQTDEDELGYTYEDIDKLLFCMIDKNLTKRDLLKKGFDEVFIRDIRERIRSNRFKSCPPVIATV